MASICAWRFSHLGTDIKKLRSSTILVMQLELVMPLLSSLPNTAFSSMLRGCWSEHSASHIACNRVNRILRLLCFHRTNELSERRSRDDPIELGSVVVDYADVCDHQIINFPFLVDAMEFVVDR
jgi:hypothetical protein